MLTHRATTILGNIPADWTRDQLKTFLTSQQGGDWGDDEGDVPIRVLRSTNFTEKGTLDFDDVALRYFTASKAEKMTLKKGDLLLERSGGGLNQPVGRVGFVLTDLPGHGFSNFVQMLRPNPAEIDPEFLGWVLLELNRSGVVERLQHQTTQMRNLDFRDYLRVYLPRPSPGEQKTNSRTLRTVNETAESASQKLSAARRIKTALMQQLFTVGVPGRHTRFTQTKIGVIPKEWELEPLGRWSSIVSGIALNTDRAPNLYPRQYLTVYHVQRERLDLSD